MTAIQTVAPRSEDLDYLYSAKLFGKGVPFPLSSQQALISDDWGLFGIVRRRVTLIVGFLVGAGFMVDLYHLLRLLRTHYLYEKDFIQFYLMGCAVRSGVYLYAPLPELASQFDPALGSYLSHASAYPPVAALLGVPFSLMPYVWSLITWTICELVCLGLAMILILRHFGGSLVPKPVLITALIFVVWKPVYLDLYFGQMMLLALLLLTLTWLSLRERRDIVGGALLGILLALKLYAWPIVLFLLLKQRMRAVAATVLVFLILHLIAASVIGGDLIVDYYLRVGSAVATIYRTDAANFSAWSIGYRMFGWWGGLVLGSALLVAAMCLALRSFEFDLGFMVMLAASTVLSPISWIHYFVTLLPVFCFVASQQHSRKELFLSWILIIMVLPGFYKPHGPLALLPFFFVIGLMFLVVSPLFQGAAFAMKRPLLAVKEVVQPE